jgi:hypothetical protein
VPPQPRTPGYDFDFVTEMTFHLQSVPNDNSLHSLVASARESLWVSSPFVTSEGARVLSSCAVPVRLLTKATAANLASKALDAEALLALLAAGAEIRSIPNLHAKVYLVDTTSGAVTSSNLTGPGLFRNVEVGIRFQSEPAFSESLRALFERLWSRAGIVSSDGILSLCARRNVATFSDGIWRNPSHPDAAEPVIPAPAIGYLELPAATDAVISPDTVTPPNAGTDPVTDEVGDLFSALPESAAKLVAVLGSTDLRVVQGAINTLELTSPEDLASWTERIGEAGIAQLASIDSHYPYKASVMRLLIAAVPDWGLIEVVRQLVRATDNEAQLVKYQPYLRARVTDGPVRSAQALAGELALLLKDLAALAAPSTLDNKSFVAPNMDRLRELIRAADPARKTYDDLAQSKRTEAAESTDSGPPSYQTIKRLRENHGDRFSDYAKGFLGDVTSGAWDSTPSSTIALFKELSKVRLAPADRAHAMSVATRHAARVEQMLERACSDLSTEVREWEKTLLRPVPPGDSAQLRHACMDLQPSEPGSRPSTGRLVNLYGNWVKAGLAPNRPSLKRLLDSCSTYLLLLGTLQRWRPRP